MMYREFPELALSVNRGLQVVAAIIWMETVRACAMEGDYILIHGIYVNQILLHATIEDYEIGATWKSATDPENNDYLEATAKFRTMAVRPFPVTFPVHTGVPRLLQEKTVSLAVMTAEEMGSDLLAKCCAVSLRRDDTFVTPLARSF